MFTGYRSSPALVYPSVGSVVAHELGPRDAMPSRVCVPNQGSHATHGSRLALQPWSTCISVAGG